MTATLIPYSRNKASGIEWLGDVPSHWVMRRLRNTCMMRVSNVDKNKRDGELPVRLCNYVDVYKNDWIQSQLDFMHATATEDEIERFRMQPGDVLITKDSETWTDIGVPALVASSNDDLVCGYHLALLRPFTRYLNSTYLLRVLQSVSVQYQFHIAATGVTRYGLSHDAIKSVRLPIPPLVEQTSIVQFLEHTDNWIQFYVRSKQNLIKLLEELKLAIIQHVLMRGLDPNIRLKASGVAWIGDVPEHWKIVRLKSLMRNIVEQTRERETAGLNIAMEHVESWTGRVIDTNTDAIFESQVKRFRSGDILFGKLNPYLAKVTRPEQSGVCVGEFLVLRCIESNINPCYAEWLLRSKSIIDEINRSAYGVKMPRTSWSFMGGMAIAIPPPLEQSYIAEFLDRTTADLDAVVASIRREVSLLREYRTRLIADVVTGKLDVREAVNYTQEESDEPNSTSGEDTWRHPPTDIGSEVPETES